MKTGLRLCYAKIVLRPSQHHQVHVRNPNPRRQRLAGKNDELLFHGRDNVSGFFLQYSVLFLYV